MMLGIVLVLDTPLLQVEDVREGEAMMTKHI